MEIFNKPDDRLISGIGLALVAAVKGSTYSKKIRMN